MSRGKGKPFARASDSTNGPAQQHLRRTAAFQRLFAGNGSVEDAEVVLTDLAYTFGYYRRPTYEQWLGARQAPDGFELHSALCNARAEVVQYVMDLLNMDSEKLIALEKAARAEDR